MPNSYLRDIYKWCFFPFMSRVSRNVQKRANFFSSSHNSIGVKTQNCMVILNPLSIILKKFTQKNSQTQNSADQYYKRNNSIFTILFCKKKLSFGNFETRRPKKGSKKRKTYIMNKDRNIQIFNSIAPSCIIFSSQHEPG